MVHAYMAARHLFTLRFGRDYYVAARVVITGPIRASRPMHETAVDCGSLEEKALNSDAEDISGEI